MTTAAVATLEAKIAAARYTGADGRDRCQECVAEADPYKPAVIWPKHAAGCPVLGWIAEVNATKETTWKT